MDAVNDPLITDIVVMKAAQIGWTEILGNVCAYFIDQDPAPILMVQPTLEMGQAWSKDRLAPMIRDTPVLNGKIEDVRSRDSGNTILHKLFPGGHLTIAGANSPSGLASRPIRILLCDEVDRYPPSAGTEGDPVNLARKRTTTFWNRKRLMGSTPTIKGASRIEAGFEYSDQRRYHVPCPHCDKKQTLKWAQVKWPEGKPADAYYTCEHCGAVITDADKPEMLRRGEWIAAKPFNGTAGFHINELYSPWVSFGEMASSFIEAKKLPETLKTFVNTAWAETWEEKGKTADDAELLNRRENYGPAVPMPGVVLVAGVDVQDDRIEVEVPAYGIDYESWSIEYNVLYGDPAKQEIWQRLDAYLLSEFEHESGIKLRISAVGVDTGHHTQQAYAFCRTRFARRVFALKGVAGIGRAFITRPSRQNKGKVALFAIGVDTGKELHYSRLGIKEPGPGYCHFPAHYEADYFAQITAEKCISKYVRGQVSRQWVKKSAHAKNETQDCRIYAMAALEILGPKTIPIAARRMEQRIKEAKQQPAEIKRDPLPEVIKPQRQQTPKVRRNFITGWK